MNILSFVYRAFGTVVPELTENSIDRFVSQSDELSGKYMESARSWNDKGMEYLGAGNQRMAERCFGLHRKALSAAVSMKAGSARLKRYCLD